MRPPGARRSIHPPTAPQSLASLTILMTALVSLTSAPAAVAAEPSSTYAEPLDAGLPADAILGKWWSEGKEGLLKIVKTKAGTYQVVLLGGQDADKQDVNNPDAKLRKRKLRGSVIMWNLKFEDGEYVDGYCYNPRDGNTYRVKMKVTGPSSLRLRGYLAIPLLGQSQDWTRAE
jgi:uncharacterized protein (DUF2147 family)